MGILQARLPKKKQHRLLLAGVLLLIIVATIVATTIVPTPNRRATSGSHQALKVVKDLPFKAVIPKDTTINKLGGWRQISPPDSDPVFAYSDTLAGISITVSQQRVPKSLRGDTNAKLADLAGKFNATEKLNITGTPVYLGASAKGPQSVLLIKNDVLVLIKSKDKINDDDWIRYIRSLQ